jgi:transposase
MQESLFMVAKLEDFVPGDDSLRGILELVNDALRRLDGLFDAIYAASGRDSIAPEKLVRALLLQIFYSVRSERQLMEQIRYNLLFCLTMEERVWDHSVFSKNRDRLLEHESNRVVFFRSAGIGRAAKAFVEGSRLGGRHADSGMARQKSFRPKNGSNPNKSA